MTEIREPNYSLDLPGDWGPAEAGEPGTLTYREKTGAARLTLTLLAVRSMFTIADQRMLLEQYLHHRSKFEQNREPWVAQSQPVAREEDGSVEGGWGGVDADGCWRFEHRVVLKGGLLADARYEARDLDEETFRERAAQVLSSLEVTSE